VAVAGVHNRSTQLLKKSRERIFVPGFFGLLLAAENRLLAERGGRPAGVPEKEWRRLCLRGLKALRRIPRANAT